MAPVTKLGLPLPLALKTVPHRRAPDQTAGGSPLPEVPFSQITPAMSTGVDVTKMTEN